MMKRSTIGRAREGWLSRERTFREFLPTWSGRDWFHALALWAAVFLAYLPVWQAGFVWDDRFYLTENPSLIGLIGLKVIWTTGVADISPLAFTTFWVEHALWGLAPLPYHLVNVLQHAACAVGLWRVLVAMEVPGAWLGAALWALHPVEVESVAWVSELKNTQSGLFFLLAILFFLRWLKREKTGHPATAYWNYGLTLLFAALAMATKSSTVILPGVLCLIAWWLEGRWYWRNLVRVAPVVVLALATSALSLWTQGMAISRLTDPALVRTVPERMVTAGIAVWFYLGKLAWPHPLITVYPRWNIDASQWSSYLPLLAVVITLFILWLKRESWGRAPFFIFTYFLCALLPVLGLFDNYIFQYSLVFDHFQYLASMGPMTLAGAGLARLAEVLIPGRPRLQSRLGVVLLVGLGMLSWQRAMNFQSEETLWADTAAKYPDSWMAHYNLGVVLAKEGRREEAKRHYQRAIALYPTYPESHVNLGFLILDEGQMDAGIAEIRQAVKVDPNSGEAHNALGSALLKKGEQDEALAEFKRATEVDPYLVNAAFNYGQLLLQRGEVDPAIRQFLKVLGLNPYVAEAYYNLGLAFMKKGQTDAAITGFQKSLEIDPAHGDAYSNLGLLLAQKGSIQDAIAQYEKALEINPESESVESNLGAALFQAGQRDEAMVHLRKAVEIAPASDEANNNLGNALLAGGQVDAAIVQYQKVVANNPNFVDAHRNLGLAFLFKGQAGVAIGQFQIVLSVNPNDATTLNLLAKAEALMRQKPTSK